MICAKIASYAFKLTELYFLPESVIHTKQCNVIIEKTKIKHLFTFTFVICL